MSYSLYRKYGTRPMTAREQAYMQQLLTRMVKREEIGRDDIVRIYPANGVTLQDENGVWHYYPAIVKQN